jgi:hypothetical protein
MFFLHSPFRASLFCQILKVAVAMTSFWKCIDLNHGVPPESRSRSILIHVDDALAFMRSQLSSMKLQSFEQDSSVGIRRNLSVSSNQEHTRKKLRPFPDLGELE